MVSELTIISGDCLSIDQTTDIRQIYAADYRKYSASFTQKDIQGNTYVFPKDFMPFIPAIFEKELFNITNTMNKGYTDDRISYIPLLILCNDKASLDQVAHMLGNIVEIKHTLTSINGLSATIQKANLHLFIKTLFTIKENCLEKTPLLQNAIKQIRLDEVVTVS